LSMLYSEATTVFGDRIIVTGGSTGTFGGPPSAATGAYQFICTDDDNPWSPLPVLPYGVGEHGSEAFLGTVYVFGGAKAAAKASWTNRYEGACPTTDVIAHTLGTGSWAPKKSMPVGVASMGTARLHNGWIALVGGRVAGNDATGAPSCHIPYAGTWFYDPVADDYVQGPSLPEGLIAPSAYVVGRTLYVVGGDETGDRVVPLATTQDRQRRPSTDVYALRFHPLFDTLGILPLAWERIDSVPLGVVDAELVKGEDGHLHLIGGNHHPEADVSLDQAFDSTRVTCVLELVGGAGPCPVPVVDQQLELRRESWLGAKLSTPRMHHAMELDWKTLDQIVHGGISEGQLYQSQPGTTAYASSAEIMPFGGLQFQEVPHAGPRAFHTGLSSNQAVIATGTTPQQHRTLDVELT